MGEYHLSGLSFPEQIEPGQSFDISATNCCVGDTQCPSTDRIVTVGEQELARDSVAMVPTDGPDDPLCGSGTLATATIDEEGVYDVVVAFDGYESISGQIQVGDPGVISDGPLALVAVVTLAVVLYLLSR